MTDESHRDCSHLLGALGEYLDGETESELCRELCEHLKECGRCRVVVDTTLRTVRFYSGQEPFRLPPGVLERLRRRLRAPASGKRCKPVAGGISTPC